jgi:hypothetical protein
MLTTPHVSPLPPGILGSAEPVEILYEAEEPVIFTLTTRFQQRLLAYLAWVTPDARWLLLAPCGDQLLEGLKQGRVPVRAALEASWLWLAKLGNGDSWDGPWAVDPATFPQEHLPERGLMLLPEHEPVLSTRAVGAQLGKSSTPASVVAYVANATRKSLKRLLEHTLERDGQGRPSDALRATYDLHVQRFGYASFEIAFTSPTSVQDDPALQRAVALLRKGITWAGSDHEAPLVAESDEERDAVLHAIKELTPPTTGVIERIDIGGQWMNHRPVVLRRAARRRVQAELRRTDAERIVSIIGRLGEFDKDNFVFILRDTSKGVDVRGSFEEELFDELLEHFTNDDRVVVVGAERGGKLYVAAVSAAPHADPGTDRPEP